MKFKIEEIKHYTTMPNEFLNDKNLKLSSKGLLATIYNLPNEWDYSMKGLCKITNTGITAIRNAIADLELNGYMSRSQTRNHLGQIEYIYFVHLIKKEKNFKNTLSIKRLEKQLEIEDIRI